MNTWNPGLGQNFKADHGGPYSDADPYIKSDFNTSTCIDCRTLPNLGVDEPDEAGLDEERYADLDPSRESEVAGIAGWYHPAPASSSGAPLSPQ